MRLAYLVLAAVLFATPVFAECETAKSHIEFDTCLSKILDTEQRALIDAERKILADNIKTESAFKQMNSVQYQGLSRTFGQSQTAFNAYMAATCDYVRASYGAGTGGSTAYIQCQRNMIAQRMKFLGETAGKSAQ